ncbi:MAG: D-tyrosyl-tRNA(Tyr) deacylase [Methanoregulaceae archaeon]|nr:D-tyrosyl-tRNA(Tyr) deacylase [Methanoregulaceae archaeon]
MKIALVHSRQDPGGKNIRHQIDCLLSAPGRERSFPLERHDILFHEVEERLIRQDHLDRSLDTDLIIFLSRHSSINPFPVLTVHVTGNIGPADLGGRPGSVAVAAPEWMHAVLGRLSHHVPAGYQVSYEVTHHGPSEIETPSFFVEIGSTDSEWQDSRAGEAVARSVLEANPIGTINLLGVGGTHYARRETQIALESRAAFGHIVHSRDTPRVDISMLRYLIQMGKAQAVYLDRKALPTEELTRLTTLIDGMEITRLSESELLQLKHLCWETWHAIYEIARNIDPKAKVHIPSLIRDGSPLTIDLPPELVREAFMADASVLKNGLEQLPVIFLSTRSTPILPVFIITGENSPVILNALISLCVTIISRGENTAIEGDQLIIRKSKFDPDRARKLGVPEGPLFGELMKGRVVTIDGHEITPDMVRINKDITIQIPGLEKLT